MTEGAGVLFIPEELGLPQAIEGAGDASSVVPLIVRAPAADIEAGLIRAMTLPVAEEPCPYGPPNALHSPACFCSLSPSTRATIGWNQLAEDF